MINDETEADVSLSQRQTAFGKFKVLLSQELGPELVETLESLYDFSPQERGQNTGLSCVEKLVEKGIINQSSVTRLENDLTELRLIATAEKISSHFKDYLQKQERENREAHLSSSEMGESPTPPLGHSSKRKLDSLPEASKEKRAKKLIQSFSRIEFYDECSLYIYKLFKCFHSLVGKNKALLLGTVFDPEDDNFLEPKLLYTTALTGGILGDGDIFYRLKCGRKIREGSYYKLQNCYYVEHANKKGVLVTPHTRCSLVSLREFRDISFRNLGGGSYVEWQDGVAQKMYLPWSTVASVKHRFPKGHTVFYLKGVVKEVDWRQSPPSPRLVLTVIDDDSGDFLSVVIPSEHASRIVNDDLVENSSVLLKYFQTKGEDTNYVISTEVSDIQIIEDESLRYLVELDDSREGYVTQVDEVQFYLACPECFHTKVDEKLRCPSCEETYRKFELENYFYVKITVELSDVDDDIDNKPTVDGLIFKNDMLKAINTYDKNVNQPQTREEVNELSEILIDKKVKVIIKPKGSRPNNVFAKLRILHN